MPVHFSSRLSVPVALLAAVVAATAPAIVHAVPATECTATNFCYCINTDFRAAIDEKVAYFRAQIADQRAKGRAVGYMSVPLSTAGGSYFGVNREVAQQVKERIEARFGAASAWVLNPTAKDADLPTLNGVRAGQGDYMLMWTRILEGPKALGEDFDFVYFVGPSDYAGFFGLTGKGDMDKLAAYFDDRLQKDADLKRAVERGTVTAAGFRNYYVLRAATSFSAGAHDEWNAIRSVNNRRRDDPKLGLTNQLPVLFDGRAVGSAEAEQPVAAGNVGACKS
ncbi:MAG: hypothetical protein ABI886_10520 [Betaproteobacteria bacterium]